MRGQGLWEKGSWYQRGLSLKWVRGAEHGADSFPPREPGLGTSWIRVSVPRIQCSIFSCPTQCPLLLFGLCVTCDASMPHAPDSSCFPAVPIAYWILLLRGFAFALSSSWYTTLPEFSLAVYFSVWGFSSNIPFGTHIPSLPHPPVLIHSTSHHLWRTSNLKNPESSWIQNWAPTQIPQVSNSSHETLLHAQNHLQTMYRVEKKQMNSLFRFKTNFLGTSLCICKYSKQ